MIDTVVCSHPRTIPQALSCCAHRQHPSQAPCGTSSCRLESSRTCCCCPGCQRQAQTQSPELSARNQLERPDLRSKLRWLLSTPQALRVPVVKEAGHHTRKNHTIKSKDDRNVHATPILPSSYPDTHSSCRWVRHRVGGCGSTITCQAHYIYLILSHIYMRGCVVRAHITTGKQWG